MTAIVIIPVVLALAYAGMAVAVLVDDAGARMEFNIHYPRRNDEKPNLDG